MGWRTSAGRGDISILQGGCCLTLAVGLGNPPLALLGCARHGCRGAARWLQSSVWGSAGSVGFAAAAALAPARAGGRADIAADDRC